MASEPRPERDCEVIERELKGEGGAGLGSLDEKFAGWYLGSPGRLRLRADALAVWLLLIEGKGTDILGESGEEGLSRDSSDLEFIFAKPLCTVEGSRLSEAFFTCEE